MYCEVILSSRIAVVLVQLPPKYYVLSLSHGVAYAWPLVRSSFLIMEAEWHSLSNSIVQHRKIRYSMV